jgi:transcriptional regulator with XRE-family HTH domain
MGRRYRAKSTSAALAATLLRTREAVGKSRVEVAEALDVDAATVESWELARTDPKCTQVRDLAFCYGLLPTQLLVVLDGDRLEGRPVERLSGED